MRIAYNPKTAAALTAAPSNDDITFDLKGIAIYTKGVKFKGTDTTYSVFKKHTSDNKGGYDGLVPVPSYTTTTTRYLREDGTWVVPTNYYRPISVNGTSILGNNNTALNLVAGASISITAENSSGYTGKVTITNTGVRSTTINGNYLRVNTNGTNADLTIPYATSAGSIAWTNVSGKPSFATVATSGSYNDLSNKPSIPTVTDYYWANVKISASSSTATSPTFQECYVNGWFRSTGNNGWYNPTHDSHIHPNATTTYGNLVVRGAKSGYTGINLGNSTSHMTVMSTELHHGLYCEADGVWEFYYNKGNKLAGILTPSLQSTSALTVGGGLHVGGTIRVVPTLSSYQEGIRIQPCGSWSVLMLLGTDTTAATSGTSAKSWGFFNNDGIFYINKNNSSGANAARAMATSTGWTFGNTSTNSYALNTASFICDSWVRTSGATGWYNESYGGGWYMTDSTWIRNCNSKPTYLSVSTYPSLVCNAQSGSEANIRFEIAGANKGYTGYKTGYGTFLWNSTASKYVYISDTGYFYTQSYINVGAGNEKNASNPPYVWGVNGSDNFMRTYATSSLSVNYASSASYAASASYATSAGYANNAGALEGYALSNFMIFGNNGGSYVNASFSNSDLSQLATDKYIEFWDSPGWFNSQWGKVTAHYGFVGNLTGTASYATSAGTASQVTCTEASGDTPRPIVGIVNNLLYYTSKVTIRWDNGNVTAPTFTGRLIGSADQVDGYHISVVTSLPSTKVNNTIYILV